MPVGRGLCWRSRREADAQRRTEAARRTGAGISGRIVGKIGGAVEAARRRVCERHKCPLQNAETGRCCRQRTDNARLTLACDGLDAANARVLVCNHLEMAQVWYKSRASLAQVWCKVVGRFRQVKRRTRLEQRLTNRRRELTRGEKDCRPFPFLCGRLHHGGNVPRQGETSFFSDGGPERREVRPGQKSRPGAIYEKQARHPAKAAGVIREAEAEDRTPAEMGRTVSAVTEVFGGCLRGGRSRKQREITKATRREHRSPTFICGVLT